MAGIRHRSLLLRGNRFLGSALVAAGLIQPDQQQAASQRLLEVIQSDNLKQASLLYILVYEMQVLKENDLVNHLIERGVHGMIDLHNYKIEEVFDRTLDLELCWTTWSLPFDRIEDIHLVASAYLLSDPVVKHWEGLLGGKIIWYITSAASLLEAFDRLQPLATPAPTPAPT